MNFAKDGGDYLSVALACLDETYRGRPVADAFLASKAHWHESSGSIPGFDEFPEGVAG